ncbi:MAG: sulfatase-like hydrolase/transferase [Planctomycetota bacterium]
MARVTLFVSSNADPSLLSTDTCGAGRRSTRLLWAAAARKYCGLATAALASSLCLLAPTGRAAAQAPQRPNVIFIMADDLGYGDTGFTGHPTIQTPNLDAMAAGGLTFDRFYSQAPVCSPTRVSALTGRNGLRTGIDQFLSVSQEDNRIDNQDITIAELAQTQGYTTGHFGKWHVGSVTKTANDMRLGAPGNHEDYSPPWSNGYDVAFVSENWMPTYDPYDNFPENGVEQAAYWTGYDQRVPDAVVDNRYTSDIIAEQATGFIQQAAQGSEPFMTTVWFTAPHIPIIADPNDTNYDSTPGLTDEQRDYYKIVTRMDAAIGEIRSTVQDLGIAEDTMIVFVSDNGPIDPGSTAGLRDQKGTLYEGGIRVPAIFEWQGTIESGTTTSEAATTSDYLPTLTDLWGIEMPDDRALDGGSILTVLRGESFEREEKLKFRYENGNRQAIMGDQYKLISNNNGNTYALFDLLNDPNETTNLAGAMPDLVNSMSAELDAWLLEIDVSRNGGDYRTGISSVNGAVIDADSPGVFTQGAYESAQPIVVVERQLATLRSDLSIDADGSASTYNALNLPSGGILDAGTVVDSFLIHLDVEDLTTAQGSVQFENDIVALILSRDNLNDSDFLSFGDVEFDTTDNRRTLFDGENGDVITVGEDGRTITFNLVVGPGGMDQIRVLTLADLQLIPVPEPGSLSLLGLGGLLMLRRRR